MAWLVAIVTVAGRVLHEFIRHGLSRETLTRLWQHVTGPSRALCMMTQAGAR